MTLKLWTSILASGLAASTICVFLLRDSYQSYMAAVAENNKTKIEKFETYRYAESYGFLASLVAAGTGAIGTGLILRRKNIELSNRLN